MSDLEKFSWNIPENQRAVDREYYQGLQDYFSNGQGTVLDKLRSFVKFVPRPEINRFLARNEIFKRILTVQGSIIECGVYLGGGLMTWAQLSSIYEPLNHLRKIIGFDTFSGFPSLHEKDTESGNPLAKEGYYKADCIEDLRECIRLYDMARPLGHIPRIELVAGDATRTIAAYAAKNAHLVVSLLYLDFDLYEPTKAAIETLLPRMPKGAVLAFDELNHEKWQGETAAVMDTVGLGRLRIERFSFQPQISFAVLE